MVSTYILVANLRAASQEAAKKRLQHKILNGSFAHNFARTIFHYVFESVKSSGWKERETLE
jgi:hypothetical protein